MARTRRNETDVIDGPGELVATLLPGTVDPDHYRRMVPVYSTASPVLDQADADVRTVEAKLADLHAAKAKAIEAGDGATVVELLAFEKAGPIELHAARIRAARIRADHFETEARRARTEAEPLGGPSRSIIDLQRLVLEESMRIREARNAADAAVDYCYRMAGEARSEAARLKRIDPTKTPEPVHGVPKVERNPEGDLANTYESIRVRGRDIVAVNGRALLQTDRDGNPVRVDGYRVAVDGVLIDENDQPVKGRDGSYRRR